MEDNDTEEESSTNVNKKAESEKSVLKDKNQDKTQEEVKSQEKLIQPQPVKFYKLYRFAEVPDYILMTAGVIGGILTGLSAPANTYLFGDVTNALVNFIPGDEEDFLDDVDYFALNNTLIGVAVLVISYISVVIYSHAIRRQIFKIRLLYFKSSLRQEMAFYDIYGEAEFAYRMSEDLNKLEEGISEKVIQVVHSLSAFFGCVILSLTEGWELALISLSAIPLILLSFQGLSVLSKKFTKKELQAYAKAAAVAQEVLSSIKTVVAFSGQKKERQRYDKHLIEANANGLMRGMFHALTLGVLWLFIFAAYSTALWFGVVFVYKEKYDPGQTTTVIFSVMVATMNLLVVGPYIEVFSSAKVAAGVVFWVIDRTSAIDPSSEEGSSPEIRGSIEFRNVYFNYPTRPEVPVLKGVSLKVNVGETVALVGTSGSGKSTCIQLIQRFYDATEGELLIDGQNISEYNVSHLREHIGVVEQEAFLFSATIKENILYAKEEATDAEVTAVCEMANARPFISKLPRGYDTMIGERGAHLSGGQKQRIAIARALIRDPRILLLDEATSALDNESEATVQRALDVAAKGRTTIIIAHRLSTIRNADKIIVLSKGQIVEQGTHDELYRREGHYFHLVTAQNMNQINQNQINPNQINQNQSNQNEINPTPSNLNQGWDEERESSEDTFEETERKTSVPQPPAPSAPPAKEESITPSKSEYTSTTEVIKKIPLKEVMRLNAPEWKWILVGTLASLLLGCCYPLLSVLFGDFMKVFEEPNQLAYRVGPILCVLCMAIGVFIGVCTFLQIWCYTTAGQKLATRLRSQTFTTLLRQEMGWFDDKANAVSILCTRLTVDASNVQSATGQPLGALVQAGSAMIFAVCFILFYQWKLGLITICIAPFLIGGSYFMFKNLRGGNSKVQKVLEKSARIVVESIGNIRTVAGLGREGALFEQYKRELKPAIKTVITTAHSKGIIMGGVRSLLLFSYALCIYYGGRLMAYEGETYPNIFRVTQTLVITSFSVAQAFAFTTNFQKGLISATKIYTLLTRESNIKSPDNESVNQNWSAEGDVTYENVTFSYPVRPQEPVLKGFNLDVLRGKKIALVGHSGCGKSTIIQLLERYYDPDSGSVSIDDHNIKTIKLNHLRKQMGIVSQEPVLFDRTIGENIAYGDNDRNVPISEIIDAAEKANAHGFISTLPLGYETPLGENGTRLSGGQKQRVAIARALIRKPKILLLDEATSALDTESEKAVQDALNKSSVGRTCIIIAHRLSTIVDADKILVLHKGAIVESGTHSELMSKKGIYRQLYSLHGK